MKIEPGRRAIQLYDGVRSNPAFIVFLAAFVLRLSLVLLLPDVIPEAPDKLSRYDPIALSLIRGQGFSIKGSPTAMAAPIYPSLLSVIYLLFGYSKTAVRITLSLIDAGQCLLMYLIAKRYFSGITARLTAVALILCPYLIYSVFVETTETPFIFLHGLFVLSFCQALQQRAPRGFLISGLFLGLTSLCRAVTLLLPVFILPVYAVVYPAHLRRGLVHLAIFLVGFNLAIAPWIIRNYVVFHQFVPIQTLGGVHLYLASPHTDVRADWSNDRATVQNMSAIDRDYYYYRSGWERITENPHRFVRLMGRRFVGMWYETGSGRYESVLLVANSGLLILAAAGMGLNRRRWRELLPFYSVIVYYVVLHMVLVALVRYILPIIPVLTMFAMALVNELLNQMRGFRWPAQRPYHPFVERGKPPTVLIQKLS
jgi:4-amino-4-deoxy-L-arabinose transferase-like glycosyltransferase